MASSLPSYFILPKYRHALQSRDEGQQSVIRLARGAPRYPGRGRDRAPRSAAPLAAEVSLFCPLALQHFWCHLGLFPCGPLVRAVPQPAHTRPAALAARRGTAAWHIIAALQWARDYGDSS